VTGIMPAAAAWSTNEEERRKALLAYFLYGVPYILWDNIALGSQISCPHIEKSCTAAYYSDRKLGVSEMVATAASTIHIFTGNNIGPKGDFASRGLGVRINVDRPDPENRQFTHPDPLGWTEENRAEILGALYTILLGNPTLKADRDAAMKTRFKMWWRLVGSAVEHAAALATQHPAALATPTNIDEGKKVKPQKVDFKELFLAQDDEDEDSVSLADTLEILARHFPADKNFEAADVAVRMNIEGDVDAAALREFFYPEAPANHIATAKSVGRLLKWYVDNPVKNDEDTLILRRHEERARKITYSVAKMRTETTGNG